MSQYQRVVMLSGGLSSYFAALRVIEKHGHDATALLFCDTKNEDADLYRFLGDIERRLNHEIIRIADGRSIWELFNDEGMIGNTRADLCSRILKRELGDRWVKANCTKRPALCFGFDWTEEHRLEGVRRAKPWADCHAPLQERPYIWKHDMPDLCRQHGIEPSRAYAEGFEHDNCGGFCVKAGHAHFALLWFKRPLVYLYHEQEEQAFRDRTGKDVAILRDRRGGKTRPLTLRAFRERLERNPGAYDRDDVGGCNCFAPPADLEAA